MERGVLSDEKRADSLAAIAHSQMLAQLLPLMEPSERQQMIHAERLKLQLANEVEILRLENEKKKLGEEQKHM